jgi:predicted LPLAT superfamily acyltransferase
VSQAWLGQRERGSIIAIRMLVGAALLLGRRVARLILYPVCLYFLVSDPKTRAASRKYLSKVLGRAPRFVDLFRHFLAFATVGLDRVYLLKDRVELFESKISGEDAGFPAAPFRLALMLKRPVVLMVGLYRGGSRYEMHFEKLFEPHGVERANRAHAIEQAVRLYAQRLEHYCRQAPYNGFNFYDFWSGSRASK